MRFEGTYKFDKKIDIIWKKLNNPEVIKACITGCNEFKEISKDVYKAKITVNLGPFNANFSSDVKIKNIVELKSYVIEADGNAGHLGFGKGNVTINLKQSGESTILNYHANTQVSGKIAQLGSRLIEGSVKKNTNSFFTNFDLLVNNSQELVDNNKNCKDTISNKINNNKKILFIIIVFFFILCFYFLLRI